MECLTVVDMEATSAFSWFGSCILVELKFGDVGFCGGKKTRKPGEKTSAQGENQQQTQPTHGTGPESNRPDPHHISLEICCSISSVVNRRSSTFESSGQ